MIVLTSLWEVGFEAYVFFAEGRSLRRRGVGSHDRTLLLPRAAVVTGRWGTGLRQIGGLLP